MKELKKIKQATECLTVNDCDVELRKLHKLALKNNSKYSPLMKRRRFSLRKKRFALIIENYDKL